MSPATRTVRVELGARSYDVVIGAGLLERAGERLAEHLPRGRAIGAVDAAAYARHGERVDASLTTAGLTPHWRTVQPGEDAKSMAELAALLDAWLAHDLERSEAVIAFGGGVVGDLAGLAAALLKRGVPYVQIPTTLLAQVDSSVGGKTAVNAPAGKNLIGAFHQPALVLADVTTLDTLERRDLAAGFAEVVKYAVIADADFFAWLEANVDAVMDGDADARIEAVARSVAWKAKIVAEDEREAGRRALLNLGHTFGHAFEAEAGYASGLRHGEAVSAGMVMACAYAAETANAPKDLEARLSALLARAGLPTSPRDLAGGPFDPEALVSRMAQDKKNQAGVIRLILPTAMGAAAVTPEPDRDRLRAFLKERAA